MVTQEELVVMQMQLAQVFLKEKSKEVLELAATCDHIPTYYEYKDMALYIWSYEKKADSIIRRYNIPKGSDEIFDHMVLDTVVGEDMEQAAKDALRYLEYRDAEERAAGFHSPALAFLYGVDTTPLDD